MNLESRVNMQESSEQRAEQYYREALQIAQEASQRWAKLREQVKSDPNFLAGYPTLAEIDSMSRPPVSGIQTWFAKASADAKAMAGKSGWQASRTAQLFGPLSARVLNLSLSRSMVERLSPFSKHGNFHYYLFKRGIL